MILKSLLFLLIGVIGLLDARDRTIPVWLVFGAVLAATGVGLTHPIIFLLTTALTAIWLTAMKVGLADKVVIPFVAGAMSWMGVPAVGISLLLGWIWVKKREYAAPLLFCFAVSVLILLPIWF